VAFSTTYNLQPARWLVSYVSQVSSKSVRTAAAHMRETEFNNLK